MSLRTLDGTICKTIVLNENILGVICPTGLQVLRASLLRGGPIEYNGRGGVYPFDPVLNTGEFRSATVQDFEEFGVVFHPQYLEQIPIQTITTV